MKSAKSRREEATIVRLLFGAIAGAVVVSAVFAAVICLGGTGLVGVVAVDDAVQSEAVYEVSMRRWTREVDLLRRGEVVVDVPCAEVPAGAKLLTLERAPGADPSRCAYAELAWIWVRTAVTEGDGLMSPPSWSLPPNEGCDAPGCERVVVRSERYVVQIRPLESGDPVWCDVPFAVWDQVQPGDPVFLPTSGVFGAARCEGILPATPEAPM